MRGVFMGLLGSSHGVAVDDSLNHLDLPRLAAHFFDNAHGPGNADLLLDNLLHNLLYHADLRLPPRIGLGLQAQRVLRAEEQKQGRRQGQERQLPVPPYDHCRSHCRLRTCA